MFSGINKVVRVLVFTDFFYNSALGFFNPIFAVFITGQIHGGSVAVAGFAASVYWITKSIFQLPIARFLDKTDGERDNFWALFFGYFFGGFIPLGYVFATEPWHLYLLQGMFGFLMAWAVPAWYSIFTRHVDTWRISFEWSLDSVFAVGVATAVAAALGGYLADHFGFRILFVLSSVVSVAASFLLLALKSQLLPRDHGKNVMPEEPPNR